MPYEEGTTSAPGSEFDLDRSSGLAAEGIHLMLIENVEERQGPKGKYIVLVLRIQGGDDDGKMLWYNVSLLPQARWKLDEALDAVGAPPTGKATGMLFMGKYVRGQVVHREWEGQLRDGVSTLMPAGDVPKEITKPTFDPPPGATPPEMKSESPDDGGWDIPF